MKINEIVFNEPKHTVDMLIHGSSADVRELFFELKDVTENFVFSAYEIFSHTQVEYYREILEDMYNDVFDNFSPHNQTYQIFDYLLKYFK